MSVTGDDTYIPPRQDRVLLTQKLKRVPIVTLCKLIIDWTRIFKIRRSHIDVDNVRDYLEIQLKNKIKRNELAKLIAYKYWPDGLNLYQLANLDSQILIHRPKSYIWNSHTIYQNSNEKFSPLIQPNNFIETLHSLFEKQNQSCHIYYCNHPSLPLLLFRIMLFDLTETSNQFMQREPFYIAFTESKSSKLIHTHYQDSDIYSKLIMQLVKETIAINERFDSIQPSNLIKSKKNYYILLKNDNKEPTKNLDNIYMISGLDRLSHSIGPWSSYAKGKSDISPLADTLQHNSIIGRDSMKESASINDLKRKTMLRFKGEDYTDKDNYDSNIPVEKVSFTLQNHLQKDNLMAPVSIKFKFFGKDVFGGIHELCDKGQIDIDKIPGWLTGENGNKSGTITNGNFKKHIKRGGLL